ncbi:MAG: hypothetical protein P1U88_13835 [Thalassobaculaceae bacterium]|nr:hypothetical protein [Thalassobaculaceae bacterium]
MRDRFVPETIIPIIQELKGLDPDGRRKGVVWDLRDADLSQLTSAALRDIFRSKNERSPYRYLRIACVVSSEIDSHILKLWAEGFDDARPYHRRWFFDLAEAVAWLLQTEDGQ